MTKTYTVINIHTHEIAYQSKSASHANRKAMALGANPAGWFIITGGTAEAKAAASRITDSHANKVRRYNANMTIPVIAK